MDGDRAVSLFSYGLERLILGCITLVIFNSVYCFWGVGVWCLKCVARVWFFCLFHSFSHRARVLFMVLQDSHTFWNSITVSQILHSCQMTAVICVLNVKVRLLRHLQVIWRTCWSSLFITTFCQKEGKGPSSGDLTSSSSLVLPDLEDETHHFPLVVMLRTAPPRLHLRGSSMKSWRKSKVLRNHQLFFCNDF